MAGIPAITIENQPQSQPVPEETSGLTFAQLAESLGLDPNNPTYEGQQKLRTWLDSHPDYQAAELTNAYLNASTTPDVVATSYPSNQIALTPEEQYRAAQAHASVSRPNSTFAKVDNINPYRSAAGDQPTNTVNPEQQTDPATDPAIDPTAAEDESAKLERRQKTLDWWAQQGRNIMTGAEGLGDGLSNIQKYIPYSAALAVTHQLTGGGDRSGEAAGYNALAAQNQYNAAQNEKLRQANMQQSTDNTIADKIAAAQAESKWKQNARALGAEGGAAVVASQNEAETPDMWRQKQLQNERRDVAAQNLAEVDKNRRIAIQNTAKASMTDYNTNVRDQLDTVATALSTGAGSSPKSNTSNEKTEDNTSTDNSAETTNTSEDTTETTQPEGTTSIAPSNQESEGIQTATDKVAINDLISKAEEINNKIKNRQASAGMVDEFNQLKAKYDELKGSVENPPAFPEMYLPSKDTTDVSSIASTIDDLTM